ncbi:hypothetical protein J3Q64DRAFT_1064778 [Phycomyces blakesleeanus]|uniref:Uncharacterized protein n=2 Tax=Phycomyces blakesleeanus TaxID=4837 RepID=A0A167Q947_PHYB8|nr:hypothetical protein PHYBLDRAFT_184737 [Phycomyces blakesleeanus NRRL 1555(-)]OAD79297.1 hypothetical protein PHYBLDRAFT_184737 [Phycomyces blakesleeanus NRRL 1555(-)]|eukprot:XP_018297337.1 hypothetical protein PHYBLDRAFT_184737 [Phycomyces blakesleeanus NRRL 1555(-)]
MPHKRAKASIRTARKKQLGADAPVTSNEIDDTPKGFARLLRFKDHKIKKQQELKDKANQTNKDAQAPPKLTIQPGEKMKDFTLRVEKEYKKDFINAVKASKPISDRKKKNRESRKEKKTAKKRKVEEIYGGRDFDDLEDKVQFGEVASAPPTFSKLPKARGRGKEVLENKIKEAKETKSTTDATDGYVSEEDENMKELKASHKRKLQNMSASARKALGDERERAIELYRAKKAQKLVNMETQS